MSLFHNTKKKIEYKPVQWIIRQDCLDIILESAKSIYPN